MAILGAYQCPRCLSHDTKPAQSGGRICQKCGEWFRD